MGYLDGWETSVASRENLSAKEKAKMCLSRETLEGIRITGKKRVLQPMHAVTPYGFMTFVNFPYKLTGIYIVYGQL